MATFHTLSFIDYFHVYPRCPPPTHATHATHSTHATHHLIYPTNGITHIPLTAPRLSHSNGIHLPQPTQLTIYIYTHTDTESKYVPCSTYIYSHTRKHIYIYTVFKCVVREFVGARTGVPRLHITFEYQNVGKHKIGDKVSCTCIILYVYMDTSRYVYMYICIYVRYIYSYIYQQHLPINKKQNLSDIILDLHVHGSWRILTWYTYICVYIYIYTCIYTVYVYVRMCVLTYILTWYPYVHICTYIHYTCVCMYVCFKVCSHVIPYLCI